MNTVVEKLVSTFKVLIDFDVEIAQNISIYAES